MDRKNRKAIAKNATSYGRKAKSKGPERVRHQVRVSYGVSTCLYCKKTFEKTRPWSKFCTTGPTDTYCRQMYWWNKNRRKYNSGEIVEVDGRMLDKPLPVIDEKLERKVEKEIDQLRKD